MKSAHWRFRAALVYRVVVQEGKTDAMRWRDSGPNLSSSEAGLEGRQERSAVPALGHRRRFEGAGSTELTARFVDRAEGLRPIPSEAVVGQYATLSLQENRGKGSGAPTSPTLPQIRGRTTSALPAVVPMPV